MSWTKVVGEVRKAVRTGAVPRRVAAALVTAVLVSSTLSNARAQTASLRGRVVDASDQPLNGVNVALRGDGGILLGTGTTDGFYLITRIPPGTYTLSYSFIGFRTRTDTLVFTPGDNVSRNVVLQEDPSELAAVTVEGERADGRAYEAGLRTIRGADIGLVPSTSLSTDLAGFLVTEPGVVTVGDRGGQLFVRGSTPAQNIFLIDGMRVYQPLHVMNAYSVYPAEIVAFADIFSSGYGAYYGGRTGAVVDVNTRNGNKRRVAGSGSLSPFMGGLHVEIPVLKDRISVLASARQSLVDRYGDRLTGQELPFRYGDRFVKMHAFLSETSNFAVTGLRSNDRGNLAAAAGTDREIAWSNAAYGGNYFYLSPVLPVLTEITVSSTQFTMTKSENGEVQQSSNVASFDGSFNFAYLLGWYQVHFGIFAQSTKFRYALSPEVADRVAEFVTEGGVFLEARFRPSSGLNFSPGLRIQTFPSRTQSYLEPRMRLSVPIRFMPGASTIAASWGVYHQGVIALTDDRSVSDVFTAWAPSAHGEPVPRSVHYGVGFSTQVERLHLSAEAYRRSVEHVGFPELGATLNADTDLLQVDGYSRGIDFAADYARRNLFVRATYGLSETRYRHEGESFAPPHDRRHTLSLASQLRTGPWRFSVLWQYGSGLPFTMINGLYNRLPVSRDPTDDAGVRQILFADSFAGRLPAYHRLDMSAERDVPLTATTTLTIQAALINSYDRSNWFDIDYETLERLDQIPIVPSFGARVSF